MRGFSPDGRHAGYDRLADRRIDSRLKVEICDVLVEGKVEINNFIVHHLICHIKGALCNVGQPHIASVWKSTAGDSTREVKGEKKKKKKKGNYSTHHGSLCSTSMSPPPLLMHRQHISESGVSTPQARGLKDKTPTQHHH